MTCSKRKTRKKTGTAIAELAVCVPVLVTIIFGSIEACNMISLQQIISESAYDGALVALRPEATEADIVSSINTVLAARNVTPQNIIIEGQGGAPLETVRHGETVRVTIEVLTNGNVVGPQLFGFSTTLSARASAIKQ